MLGLAVDLGGFYRITAGDARLNSLAARFRGMCPPCFPRWQPYAGLVYFHLLLDALAARGDLEEAR